MKLLTRKKTNFRATAETNGVAVVQNLGNRGAWVKVRVAGLVGFVNCGDVRVKDSASE